MPTYDPDRKCLCGCGSHIPFPKRGPQGRWILGHQAKSTTRVAGSRRYIPRPEEIPSGICECGCGGRTALAAHTDIKRGRFKGYPARYIQGHAPWLAGARHQWWRGGRIVDSHGYVRVRAPKGHPTALANGYMAEHRLVMEGVLGRYLEPNESVHHINGVRSDNRPENLELWTTSQPYGQRVTDKVQWAIDLLNRYSPESLATAEKK